MSHNVFTGARAIFQIGGEKIAFGTNVDGSEEVMYEPIDVLDNLETQEHAPVGYRVNFSCGFFRTLKNTPGAQAPREGKHGSPKDMGLFPKAGADILSVLRQGVLTATITDRMTGQVIMRVEGCKMSSHNFNVTPRGVVSTNSQWVAIRMLDETEGA